MKRFVLFRLPTWLMLASATFAARAEVTNGLRLVSGLQASCRSGAGASYNPSFSADGRSVLFVSHAHNLATNDNPSPHLNVFVRELAAAKTTVVSVDSSGTGGGEETANYPSISSNGQFVAFSLPIDVTNPAVPWLVYKRTQVFLRDAASSTNRLVSANASGAPSFASSASPQISDDGRWVVFESSATDLVTNDFNNLPDVFARDLWSNQTVLVSVNATNGCSYCSGPGSQSPSISADGRFIAFVGIWATNLVPGVTNMHGEVYVRDMQAGLTCWASTNVANQYTAFSRDPVISANGRAVVFKARPSQGYPVFTFRYDVEAQTNALIGVASEASLAPGTNWQALNPPVISADGRFVAYEDATDIFVWDAQLQTNILVSVNHDGSGRANGCSHSPAMTPDGQSVAFVSMATDLATPGPPPGTAQVYVRDLVAGTTRLVTVNRDGAASRANHELIQPAISPDGSLVAFESEDDNLVADDLNRASDVFVRDLNANTTSLVSERAPSRPALTGPGLSGLANASCISSNARWLAFTSLDNDFVPGDTNGMADIFIRDLETGACSTVGIGTNFTEQPVLSADGRYLAYVRWNVGVPFAPGATSQVYRYNLQTATSELASVRYDGSGPAGGSSTKPVISPDGRFVAFESKAEGLVPLGPPPTTNIFLRDMEAGSNFLVSVSLTGSFGNGASVGPMFSPDGRWLLFQSLATDLVTNNTGRAQNGGLFARDLSSNRTVFASQLPSLWPGGTPTSVASPAFSADSRWLVFLTDRRTIWVRDLWQDSNAVAVVSVDPTFNYLYSPSVSAGGRLVAYEQQSWGPVLAYKRQVVVYDQEAGTTTLITSNRAGTGTGNDVSTSPLLTPDGQFVVFTSRADDLVFNDWGRPWGLASASDVFVYDRLRRITLLVSANAQGLAGTNASSKPILAPDGRTVVFQSFAGDLVPGDYNETRDLFLLRLSAGDHDGDGLDDDWEMAFFSTLDRDGSGDFDNDGLSDRAEFLAGTDPTNSGSILRAMIRTPVGGGNSTILWPAAPGRLYKVQFKADAEGAVWQDVPGTVSLAAGTGSLVDANSGLQPRRFYRVVLRQ